MVQLNWLSLTAVTASFLALVTTTATIDGSGSDNQSPSHNESLAIRRLDRGHLQTTLKFETRECINSKNSSVYEAQHLRLLPRNLMQIMAHTSTLELHVRFQVGRWNFQSWGSLPDNGSSVGCMGAEVWAFIEKKNMTRDAALEKWKILALSLSGLLCGSFNVINEENTFAPKISFIPQGPIDGYLFYSVLPQESVCTENLTPFMKLLPCKGRAGLSALLNSHQIFNCPWSSIALDVIPLDPHTRCVSVLQKVDNIFDTVTSVLNPIDAIRSQGEYFKSLHEEGADPKKYFQIPLTTPPLKDFFQKDAPEQCFVSNDTHILSVQSPEYQDLTEGVESWNGVQNFLEREIPAETLPYNISPILVERSMTGFGGEFGKLVATITNQLDVDLNITYLEVLPWYLKPYMHTLKVKAKVSEPASAAQQDSKRLSLLERWIKPQNEHIVHGFDKHVVDMYYLPSQNRRYGSQIEMKLTVPAGNQLLLSFDFDKPLLRLNEYPSDANRGFDIPSAIIAVLDGNDIPTSYIRTSNLLLALATPDFSMPFNVIIFTSTVIALTFGTIFNALTRIWLTEAEAQNALSSRLSPTGSLKSLISRYRRGRIPDDQNHPSISLPSDRQKARTKSANENFKFETGSQEGAERTKELRRSRRVRSS